MERPVRVCVDVIYARDFVRDNLKICRDVAGRIVSSRDGVKWLVC